MTPTRQHDAISNIATVGSDGGEARWWFGTLAVIKLSGAETNGGLTVVDVTVPPGAVTPPHVHHREEETFYMLEGSATFLIGERQIEAAPGDLLVGPRDLTHGFRAGPDGARLLFLLTPSGLEGLVREQSEPAPTRTLPPADATPPDLAQAREIALRYGCELFV